MGGWQLPLLSQFNELSFNSINSISQICFKKKKKLHFTDHINQVQQSKFQAIKHSRSKQINIVSSLRVRSLPLQAQWRRSFFVPSSVEPFLLRPFKHNTVLSLDFFRQAFYLKWKSDQKNIVRYSLSCDTLKYRGTLTCIARYKLNSDTMNDTSRFSSETIRIVRYVSCIARY